MSNFRNQLNPAVVPPDLRTFAAREYRRRADAAQARVDQGRWDRDQATAKLRPWLAIACLVGADLAEIEPFLAEIRVKNLDGDWRIGGRAARVLLAIDICPRRIWARDLAAARDAVMNALDDNAAGTGTVDVSHARGMLALVRHLEFDPNGRWPIPPWQPAATAAPLEQAA